MNYHQPPHIIKHNRSERYMIENPGHPAVASQQLAKPRHAKCSKQGSGEPQDSTHDSSIYDKQQTILFLERKKVITGIANGRKYPDSDADKDIETVSIIW